MCGLNVSSKNENNIVRMRIVRAALGREANSKRTRNSSKMPNKTYKEQKPNTNILWFVDALSS